MSMSGFSFVCTGKARLLSVLRPAEGGLLWRTARADVLGQIGLPPQTHRMTYLTLNAIERHFYLAQHKVHALLYVSAAHELQCDGLNIADGAAAADSACNMPERRSLVCVRVLIPVRSPVCGSCA